MCFRYEYKNTILLTKIAVTQNEVALSYHKNARALFSGSYIYGDYIIYPNKGREYAVCTIYIIYYEYL